MSAEENKAIVRQWIDEVYNNRQPDRVARYYAPDYTLNGKPQSIESIKQNIAAMQAAIPDLHITIEDIIAEGDKVAYRYTWRATPQEAMPGPFGPIQPTGKTVTWAAMTFVRLADGKIVEDWFTMDALGLFQQLGAIPTSEQTQ